MAYLFCHGLPTFRRACDVLVLRLFLTIINHAITLYSYQIRAAANGYVLLRSHNVRLFVICDFRYGALTTRSTNSVGLCLIRNSNADEH